MDKKLQKKMKKLLNVVIVYEDQVNLGRNTYSYTNMIGLKLSHECVHKVFINEFTAIFYLRKSCRLINFQ